MLSCPLFFLPLLVQQAQCQPPLSANCYIEIQSIDFSAKVAKVFLLFDQTTSSDDFNERADAWLVAEQYGYEFGIGFGRAHPDWKLVSALITKRLGIGNWKKPSICNMK